MSLLVSRKYFVMPSNAHRVKWQYHGPRDAIRWFAITVDSISVTAVARQLMDMTISGLFI